MNEMVTDDMVTRGALEARAWGVVSKHGEWTNEETQQQCARDILEVAASLIAAKVLRDAAEQIDGYTDWEEYKNRTLEAPHGWSDESIHDALMSSGVLTDWLRNRADHIERGES